METKPWGKTFNRELAKGADHGHAAFMAGEAENRARLARRRLHRVINAMVEDVLNATDEEIIAEAKEDGWPEEEIDHLRNSLARAKEAKHA